MLLGCGGSHLNEFQAYHHSRGKANQSLPTAGGAGGDRGKRRCDTRESSSVSGRCLPQQPSAKDFPKGTLVLIKRGPILNSNPLAWLASSGDALSNHWDRWMFLHYHGWTLSINRVRVLSGARVWVGIHSTPFLRIMQLFVMKAHFQFIAKTKKKVVSRTFWPYVPLWLWAYLTSWINHVFVLPQWHRITFSLCFSYLAWGRHEYI